MKVFISSTYKDLIEYRAAAIRAVEGTNYQASKMEVFGARPNEPLDACLKEVEESDFFIGIYAHRYGYVPAGSDISITEMEYTHARKLGKPIYAFVIDEENQPWLPKFIESEPGASKLKVFKQKIQTDHVCAFFTTSDDLGMKVANALSHYAANHLEPSSQIELAKPTGSTLPYQPYFFGREKELAIIADAIAPESRTWGALIDGPGGIGKTALAIRSAHLAQTDLFERKIFITAKVRELTPEGEKHLKDFSRDNYFSMLNELALELGEEGIPRLAPDERANPLRMALAGKKTLIIFDNLETLSEDERTRLFQFLTRLPEGNKAIVTSRRRADVDARIIRLDRLSANEALQLMEELAKNNTRLEREDEEARHGLYEITHGNPLLIKWVCGQLGREGSVMKTLVDAAEFIKNAPTGNDPLEYVFGDLLETFKPNEVVVLAALTHFAYPAKLKWLADMTELDEKVVETVLEDLADRSILVSNIEGKEFYLPTLAAEFIRIKRLAEVDNAGKRLGTIVYTLVVKNKLQGGQKIAVLEENWLLISASLLPLSTGSYDDLDDFCESFPLAVDLSSRTDEYIWLLKQAETKAVSNNDKVRAGWHTYNQALSYWLRHEIAQVQNCMKRLKTYWGKSKEHRLRAMNWHLKALILEQKKNYSAAIRSAEKALAHLLLEEKRSSFLASELLTLARIQMKAKNYEASKKNYSEAFRISLETKIIQQSFESMNGLAKVLLEKGELKPAEEIAQIALKTARKTKNDLHASISCETIAKVLLQQGTPQEVLRYVRRAIKLLSNYRNIDLHNLESLKLECQQAIKKKRNKKAEKTKKK